MQRWTLLRICHQEIRRPFYIKTSIEKIIGKILELPSENVE